MLYRRKGRKGKEEKALKRIAFADFIQLSHQRHTGIILGKFGLVLKSIVERGPCSTASITVIGIQIVGIYATKHGQLRLILLKLGLGQALHPQIFVSVVERVYGIGGVCCNNTRIEAIKGCHHGWHKSLAVDPSQIEKTGRRRVSQLKSSAA
jgi:hypothetical protein